MRHKLALIIAFSLLLNLYTGLANAQTQVIVIENTIYLRSGPSTTSDSLVTIPKSTVLDVIEKSGDWYKVSYQGKTGYVASWVVSVYQNSSPGTTTTATTQALPILLNGQPMIFDVAPVIVNDRTLVPVRAIFEAMGAQVTFDNNVVTGTKDDLSVVLVVGEKQATLFKQGASPQLQTLDAPATMVDSRVLAPLRFVCETFGGTVTVDSVNKVIRITTPGNTTPGNTVPASTTPGTTSSTPPVSNLSTNPATSAPVDVTSTLTALGSHYSLTKYAQALIGVPYQYGGTTLTGFDCSGYTQYVYAHFGITLGRSAADQAVGGAPVDFQSLAPGDLLFFYTNDLPPGTVPFYDGIDRSQISHVGIYAGNFSMLHASNNGVTISAINNDYYIKRYAGARRMCESLPEK